MSEVQRYCAGKYGLVEGEALGRLSVVLAAHFDRVTAERDAALGQRLQPVAVVMRCSFCDVVNEHGSPWSCHSESVDGNLVYRVIGCKDHKHLVDACLDGLKHLNDINQ